LGNTSEEVKTALRSNPKAVSRLANLNETVADQLRGIGYSVETNPYVRAKIYKNKTTSQHVPGESRQVRTEIIEEPIIETGSQLHNLDDFEYLQQDMPKMISSDGNYNLV